MKPSETCEKGSLAKVLLEVLRLLLYVESTVDFCATTQHICHSTPGAIVPPDVLGSFGVDNLRPCVGKFSFGHVQIGITTFQDKDVLSSICQGGCCRATRSTSPNYDPVGTFWGRCRLCTVALAKHVQKSTTPVAHQGSALGAVAVQACRTGFALAIPVQLWLRCGS